MRADEIKTALKAWGHATVNRYAYGVGRRSVHSLAKVRDHAPGTTENALRQLIGRDGRERREYMAARSGVGGLKVVPVWAVDPVRGSNDADRPHDNPAVAVDMGIPHELLWVEYLVSEMKRCRPMMAACVVEEYTTIGSQAVKARRVKERTEYDGAFSKWMYRAELDKAVLWIDFKLDSAA